MANSNHIHVPMEEENPLNTVPGSGDVQNNGDCFGQEAATFRNGKHHRTLAICSIICGISCIGIKALINSVKAEHTTEPRAAARFSRLARKYGIISILTWVVILALVPPLMALVSFLLTLSD